MYIVTFYGNCLFVCLFVTWLVQFETMSAFCEWSQFQPLQTMLDLWHGMIHWDKWHFIMTSLALRHNMSILHCYMARSDVVRLLVETGQETLHEGIHQKKNKKFSFQLFWCMHERNIKMRPKKHRHPPIPLWNQKCHLLGKLTTESDGVQICLFCPRYSIP